MSTKRALHFHWTLTCLYKGLNSFTLLSVFDHIWPYRPLQQTFNLLKCATGLPLGLSITLLRQGADYWCLVFVIQPSVVAFQMNIHLIDLFLSCLGFSSFFPFPAIILFSCSLHLFLTFFYLCLWHFCTLIFLFFSVWFVSELIRVVLDAANNWL